jgi:hypothetical protein
LIRQGREILGEMRLGDSGKMTNRQIVLLDPVEELGDINAVAKVCSKMSAVSFIVSQ